MKRRTAAPDNNGDSSPEPAPSTTETTETVEKSDTSAEEAEDALSATFPPREDIDALTIVGLGGSAGSINALETFFQHLPESNGRVPFAYVVILHLSRDYESHLAELLSRSTRLPVQRVTETTKVERDHVYVIPPGKRLELSDGSLVLHDLEASPGTRGTVDAFFRTLATSYGPQSVAVVLSGSGADGTLGLRSVKEAGGLVVAQSPGEAEYDAMPRSAIASGLVDYVLPVAAIPAQIATYWDTSARMRLPREAAPSPEQEADGRDQEAALRDILHLVRSQTGHDFALYKRATVLRRIGRRMQVNTQETLLDYLEFLRRHPAEISELVADLLISVTQFFRDPEAWAALERDTIPHLFHDKAPQAEVRAWVCGCATGEEAYTLAMLLLERAARSEQYQTPPRIQVFATDMNTDAIARARDGIYPETIAADLTEERLRRWFYRQNGTFQVRKELREAVLFASHDVLRDTPFSRLDLVTCRNLLIYLNRDAQQRVFETFHFALRPDGRLFLGPSESADSAPSLFVPTDKQFRIYIRRPIARAGVPPIPMTAIPGRVMAPSLVSPLPLTHAPNRAVVSAPIAPQSPSLTAPSSPVSGGRELLRSLMERYGPPTALVNDAYEIIHLSNGAGQFLRVADGDPSQNLMHLIHPDLRVELRTALFAAASEGGDQVRLAHVALGGEGQPPSLVRLLVRPVEAPEGARGYFLVQMEEVSTSAPEIILPAAAAEIFSSAVASADVARQLEDEISSLQGQLRSTVEQYEALTEELKASNEELQAMNEELRSAAEELETSKEELQSVNEELSTVNHELKARVEEVSRTNSDLQNFLSSTDIGTIFLDRTLRIKRYTPAAESLFNLIPTDAGRPLSDITNRLNYPTLTTDAEGVLARLLPVEREVSSTDEKRHFVAHLLPYRTMDDRIEGVVLSFIEITARKEAEEALRTNEKRMRGQKEAFQAAMNGASLADTLRILSRMVSEETAGEARTAFYLADPDGPRLHPVRGAGDMPDSYADRVDGFSGGEDAVGGGLANPTTGRPILIRDVFEEPRWEPWMDLAQEYNYRGCWSFPIATRDGGPIGTFAMYWRTPREATPRDLALADAVTQAATIIISRQSEVQERTRAEAALRENVDELTRFNRAAVHREMRMIELKKEVNELAERHGEAERYPLEFENENEGEGNG